VGKFAASTERLKTTSASASASRGGASRPLIPREDHVAWAYLALVMKIKLHLQKKQRSFALTPKRLREQISSHVTPRAF